MCCFPARHAFRRPRVNFAMALLDGAEGRERIKLRYTPHTDGVSTVAICTLLQGRQPSWVLPKWEAFVCLVGTKVEAVTEFVADACARSLFTRRACALSPNARAPLGSLLHSLARMGAPQRDAARLSIGLYLQCNNTPWKVSGRRGACESSAVTTDYAIRSEAERQQAGRQVDGIRVAKEERHAKRTAAQQAAHTKRHRLVGLQLRDAYLQKHFVDDDAVCGICDRLWFRPYVVRCRGPRMRLRSSEPREGPTFAQGRDASH